jgi:hypothetical protein
MRRIYLCLALVAGVTALVTAVLVAAKPEADRQTITLLFPKQDSTENLLWPNDHAYVFSINRPHPENPALSAVVRSVHEELKKGISPAIGDRLISKAESEEEKNLSIKISPPPQGPIIVYVQLIDLSEITSPAKADNPQARLRLGIRNKGFSTSLGDDQTLIEGKPVGVNPRLNARWKDGELHLINLFMQKGERFTTYDVVILDPK